MDRRSGIWTGLTKTSPTQNQKHLVKCRVLHQIKQQTHKFKLTKMEYWKWVSYFLLTFGKKAEGSGRGKAEWPEGGASGSWSATERETLDLTGKATRYAMNHCYSHLCASAWRPIPKEIEEEILPLLLINVIHGTIHFTLIWIWALFGKMDRQWNDKFGFTYC